MLSVKKPKSVQNKVAKEGALIEADGAVHQ
jgi:hypothetical protein